MASYARTVDQPEPSSAKSNRGRRKLQQCNSDLPVRFDVPLPPLNVVFQVFEMAEPNKFLLFSLAHQNPRDSLVY